MEESMVADIISVDLDTVLKVKERMNNMQVQAKN